MRTPFVVFTLCLGAVVGCGDNASDPGTPSANPRYIATPESLLSIGSPAKDEDPSGADQYPSTVTEVTALPDGYSHRVAMTSTAGVFLGAWVRGPDGAQDIYYKFFER